MKIKAIIASVALAVMGTGALTVGLVNSSNAPVEEAKAANKEVFFNISEFGPKYGDKNQYDTQFSVNAFGSDNPTDYPQTWLAVAKVDGYPNVIKVSCDESYTKFIVVRSAQGTINTWPNDSTESWDQTSDFARTSSNQNYCWVWSSEGHYGDKCVWREIKDTTLDVNGVSQDMTYNFNNNQYEITHVSLTSTDSLTITRGTDVFGYTHLEDKSLFTVGTDNAFLPKNDSVFAFYLKEDNGGTIWAQIDSGVEAETWAEKFVKGVGCAEPYNAKPANWDTYASSFGSLTNGAKDTLIGATASNASGATYVEQAAFIHDMCVRKYAGCSVFMRRDGGGSRASSMTPITKTNNTALVVVVCSSVVAISLFATVLFLKKRKEN